ncbi:twin-arginine translocase subunit TatC [Paenisporosarcina antarctica]|uniref:Sec-independent protein translocase protein TatC n=1 Tax=Paenisporosarcina antarctica TaxID=417367 RepID=A0A4P6ZV33_9BACL|nr:twin-arginine translocase subunit TatC [Paenisporosarcina antarctica]QBP40063.1 twin-arginine translocase subunit TatC [Paenisporosarcina antarctica]
MNEKDLTLIEHIDEIRKRLMITVVFFVIAVLGSFFLAKPLIHFLQYSEEAKSLTLNAFTITDPIMIYLKVIMFIAMVITSPVILYQLWSFVSPGLHETERKATLSYIPFTFFLFVGGILFSYKVLFPYVINFMILLSTDLDINQVIGINEYFTFLFQITVPFGIIFQLPIVLLFLTRLGMVTPMMMVKVRKYAYFVLFVIAAFITPPDIFSHLLVTLPLFILYEISVMVSRIGYKKYLKSEQRRQREEQQALIDNMKK